MINKNDKEINKIALTITAATLGSFCVGSVLMYLACFAILAGLNEIVNDFIVIYLLTFLLIGVMIFGISRTVMKNEKAYHFWIKSN